MDCMAGCGRKSRRPPWGRPARDHAGRRRRIGTLHRGRATTADRLHLGVGGNSIPIPPGSSIVTIELEPADSGTMVRLTHSGLQPAEMRAASQRMGTLLGPARASRDWRRPRARPLWQVALPRQHAAVKSRYPEFVHCLFVSRAPYLQSRVGGMERALMLMKTWLNRVFLSGDECCEVVEGGGPSGLGVVAASG